jgi:hypothetical protein
MEDKKKKIILTNEEFNNQKYSIENILLNSKSYDISFGGLKSDNGDNGR